MKICTNGDFRKFLILKSVLLTIKPGLMVEIVINNVFDRKNKEILVKSLIKICKNGDFQHISNIFGRKKIFSKIGLSHVLGIPNKHLSTKNQKKQMMKS